jgi:Lon protease-like protein
VCQIRSDETRNAAGAPALLPYAGVGVLSAHHQLSDGRYNILVQPVGRVRLRSDVLTDRLYRVADADLLDDEPVSDEELAGGGERVRRLFGPLVGRLGTSGEAVGRALDELPPGRVPEALASVVLRGEEERQRFLAEGSPLRRAALVEEALLLLLAELSGGSAAEA